MTRRRVLRASAGLVVLGSIAARAPAAAGAATDAADDALPADLVRALRAGGHVLVMRHAATDPGVGDPPGFRLEHCATQRNLSPAGQAQARRFGARLAQAGVPVSPVLGSRWCRCLDTARLAFGRVEPWPPLDSFFEDRGAEAARTAHVRSWIQAFDGPGNAVLVTHQVNATALAGGWLAMGEALVLTPSDGAPRQLGRLAG